MSGTFYKNFAIKWGTNCTRCGKRLDPGASGWGTKDPGATRWKFLCDHCHSLVAAEPVDERTEASPGDEVDTKISESFLNMLPEAAPAEPAEANVNMSVGIKDEDRPLLERLRDSAPWRTA